MANPVTKPAPKWFRITKTVWSLTENFVIALLLLYYAQDAKVLLIFKLASSFLKQILDSVLVSESEDYAPIDTTNQN